MAGFPVTRRSRSRGGGERPGYKHIPRRVGGGVVVGGSDKKKTGRRERGV